MQLFKQRCLGSALAATLVSFLVIVGQSQAGQALAPAQRAPLAARALDDYNTGSSYAKMGDYNLAIKYFDKSIAYRTPKFAAPYINKGSCLQKLGYHDKAILCYNEALKIDPKLYAAYQNRGSAFLHLNKFAEALKDFNATISLPRPSSLSSVTVYIDRGRAYAGLRRWKESFADFDYVINMQTNSQILNQLKAAAMSEKRKAELRMAEVGTQGITRATPAASTTSSTSSTSVSDPASSPSGASSTTSTSPGNSNSSSTGSTPSSNSNTSTP